MTLCIAALCRERGEKVGSRAIISFDRRVETGIAGADIEFKYVPLTNRWSALIAGDVSLAREFAIGYAECLADREERLVIAEANSLLREPLKQLREEYADRLVRERLAIPFSELKANGAAQLPGDSFRQMWYDISVQQMGVELILLGFIEEAFHLYRVANWNISRHEPFAVIGSGSYIAEAALFQRGQRAVWTVPMALYAVYEAQKLGEIAPGVGASQDIAVLTFEEDSGVTPSVASPSLRKGLDKQFKEFGPKVISLDHPLPSGDFTRYGERKKRDEAD